MTSRGNVYIVGTDIGIQRMWYSEGFNVLLGDAERNIDLADIVCFIGGDDVDPPMYGQVKNKHAHVHSSLYADKRDLSVWNMTPKDTTKVGICRGGQFLHVMNGGTLYQDVDNHHASHKVYDTVWKKELVVTSSHHQMMKKGEAGDIFTFAEKQGERFQGEYGDIEAPDVEPEGIWYDNTRSLCLQFHPEWVGKDTPERNYFLNLIDLVRS